MGDDLVCRTKPNKAIKTTLNSASGNSSRRKGDSSMAAAAVLGTRLDLLVVDSFEFYLTRSRK